MIFFRRLCRLIGYQMSRWPLQLRYRRLKANFVRFWMSDSDAQNSFDPFDVIWWFRSRGDRCLSAETVWDTYLFRRKGIVIRLVK